MEQKLKIAEATMSTNQAFENLLDSVKCSNLNFHIQQTPFTAIISVKKSLIRDKFGNFLAPTSQAPKIRSSLEAENHALQDKIIQLEKNSNSLQNDLVEAVGDSENGHKTIRILESGMKNLSDKLEEALQQNSNKTKDIDALSLKNKRLEKQLTEAAKAIEKFEEEKSELSDLVTEVKKELVTTDKALKRSNVRKENLDKMVEDLQGKNDELLCKVEYFDAKLHEFEKKPEPAATKTSSTNTHTSSTSSTASQSDWNAADPDCPHLRQPDNSAQDPSSLDSTPRDSTCLDRTTHV